MAKAAQNTQNKFDQVIALLEGGEKNRVLEDVLPEDLEQTSIPSLTDETCQLCKIDKYPFDSEESIFYQNDDFYIVDTAGAEENGLKGHEVRNMAVIEQHGHMPTSGREMFDRLVDITASHIQGGQMAIYGSMNSINEHFHFVASDIYGDGDEPIDDLSEVSNYVLYDVKDGEAKLVAYNSNCKVGDYIHEIAELP